MRDYAYTKITQRLHKDYTKSADEQSENFTKQPVDKYRKISFCNLCV